MIMVPPQSDTAKRYLIDLLLNRPRLPEVGVCLEACNRWPAAVAVAGWPGIRNAGCGRSHWGEHAERNAAETPRREASSRFSCCYEPNRANESSPARLPIRRACGWRWHTVSVVAQVTENVFWAAEWSFGVDDPLLATGLAEKFGKRPWCGQIFQLAGKTQFPRQRRPFSERPGTCREKLSPWL